jgi:hypothetical protein
VLFVNVDVFLASHRRGDLPGPTALTVIRKSLGWLLMIVVATNLTYFLANFFLDPRANYLQLRPPRTPEQISRSLAPVQPQPGHPVAGPLVALDQRYRRALGSGVLAGRGERELPDHRVGASLRKPYKGHWRVRRERILPLREAAAVAVFAVGGHLLVGMCNSAGRRSKALLDNEILRAAVAGW